MKVDLDEIGDGAVENAIGEITGGAPEKKSEARSVQGADAAAGDEQPGDDRDDDERADDQRHAQGGRRKTSEEAEGDAGVAGVNEIKKIINNCGGETISGAGFDPGLGGAVKKDNGKGEPEEAKARRKSHEGEEVKDAKKVKEIKEEERAELLELMKRLPRVWIQFRRGLRSNARRRWGSGSFRQRALNSSSNARISRRRRARF